MNLKIQPSQKYMNLSELLDQQFKVKTRTEINQQGVTNVGTSVKKLLGNNPNRLAWIIINLSVNTLYIALTNDPSSSKGILVGANGGTASMLWNEDFEATGYEIWGLGSSTNTYVYIIEVVTAE